MSLSFRLRQTPVRIAAALGSWRWWPSYLIAQMVGAGNLIKLMFGLSYETAVVIVGVVMLAYVLFGGMIATTWVQIVKAGLLLGGAALLAMLVLARFDFNPRTCSPPRPSSTARACWLPGSSSATPGRPSRSAWR